MSISDTTNEFLPGDNEDLLNWIEYQHIVVIVVAVIPVAAVSIVTIVISFSVMVCYDDDDDDADMILLVMVTAVVIADMNIVTDTQGKKTRSEIAHNT